MTKRLSRAAFALLAVFAFFSVIPIASAQEEFPPPQGKGRLVVISSGMSGPEHYKTVARAIAQMGYDVVLFDSNPMEGTHGEALKTALQQAQQMPNALPGKAVLMGFSLGGGITLGFGVHWPDQVAGVIVWYPATKAFHNIPSYANSIQVPVLMFAGESDTFRDCCLIDTAHTIASAAGAAGKQFELITYPKTEHDFVDGGSHYNAKSYNDALQRTAAKLKELFGN